MPSTPTAVAQTSGGAPPEVVLVVPCYNEEQRLDFDAFAELLAGPTRVLVLFVDDGSRDQTLALVRGFAVRYAGGAAVLALAQNQGKAEAVRQGMLHGLGYDPMFVGFWDADLATPLSAVPALGGGLRARPRCHGVVGGRVGGFGRGLARRAVRHYAGRVFATAASVVLRLPVYDTQCGAKLFRADAALREVLRDRFLSRWLFDVEMIARYGRLIGEDECLEDRIYELPLDEWRDVKGSKVTAGAFLVAALELARIARRYPARAPARAPAWRAGAAPLGRAQGPGAPM